MKGLSYKWLVMMTVIFGLFMVILDTTIVNIAVPRLQADFGASLSDIAWVATGYTLAEGIGIPLTPFFLSLLGNKRYYLLLLGAFTISSALCGLSWNLQSLVVFRILQGLAGASMIPMSITLLFAEFPPQERGMAMGSLGVPMMLAPALGPIVGGYIVTYQSWRLMFYINVPIGIIGFFMAFFLLRESKPEGKRQFDLPGFLFSAIGMASLLYALDDAGTDGWGSSKVLSLLAVGITSLVLFIVVELLVLKRGRQPLMDLRVYRVSTFVGGNLVMLIVIFGMYGGLFLTPLYLQSLRGLSAYQAGLVLLPQAFGMMIASVLGGRLADKLGVKAVVIPGLLITGVTTWYMAYLTQGTPFSTFQLLLIFRGMGLGLSMQPATLAALADIKPAMLSQASTLNSVARSVGSALAVAIVSTLVTARTKFHYVRLAEQVTAQTPSGHMVQQMAAYYMAKGIEQQKAMAMAIGGMVQKLQLQSYMLAMNDAFYITIGAVSLAIIVTLALLRSPRKSAATQPASEKVQEGETAPVEEEEMAFVH